MRCSNRISFLAAVAALLMMAAPGRLLAALRVVATLPVFGEMAETIGGERVRVSVVAKPLQDPHFIQPTPWSVARVSRADMFVTAGLDLELWRGPLLEAAANRKVFVNSPGYVDLSQAISLLQVPTGNVDRQAGDLHVMGNPHYYYTPDGLAAASEVLEARMIQVDPAGAEGYAARAGAYRVALAEASRRWQEALRPYQGRQIVPFHNSFPYLEQWSGLRIMDHVEPKPGINPSAAHLARLTIRMKREGVKVVLHEPWYNQRFSESLARRADARVVMFYSQPGKGAPGASYIEMMDANVRALVEALAD